MSSVSAGNKPSASASTTKRRCAVGLITANVARQMFTTYRHTYLIAGASLVGMLVLAAGQFIVEHVMVYSVPVSVFVTIGGGIYFLYLILTQK